MRIKIISRCWVISFWWLIYACLSLFLHFPFLDFIFFIIFFLLFLDCEELGVFFAVIRNIIFRSECEEHDRLYFTPIESEQVNPLFFIFFLIILHRRFGIFMFMVIQCKCRNFKSRTPYIAIKPIHYTCRMLYTYYIKDLVQLNHSILFLEHIYMNMPWRISL